MKTKIFVEFEKRKDSYITLLQCGACCRIVGSLQRKLNADCRSRDSETANSPLLSVRLDSYVIMMCYFFYSLLFIKSNYNDDTSIVFTINTQNIVLFHHNRSQYFLHG